MKYPSDKEAIEWAASEKWKRDNNNGGYFFTVWLLVIVALIIGLAEGHSLRHAIGWRMKQVITAILNVSKEPGDK